MQLIAVSHENIDAYAAYRRAIADKEARRYYETIDLEKAILAQANDFFVQNENREIICAVTLKRKERRDGVIRVMISVEDLAKNPETLVRMLRLVLEGDAGKPLDIDTRYQVYDPSGGKFPVDEMAKMGFAEIPGTYRYVRKKGLPRDGEFPYADRAVALGYTIIVIDADYIARDPDIYEKLADIYNRAFSSRDSVNPTTADRMRRNWAAEANETIIAKLGDEVTGCITLTHMGDSVLVPQVSCLRRHWGTGSVDLICRHLTELVAERWNIPIIGYAEATNAASWKALERFGLTRLEEYLLWELAIPAGGTLKL